MEAANFLCAIDLADPCLLSSGRSMRIKGWIIARDGPPIDRVIVEVNDRHVVRTAFPTPRVDVKNYYPGIRNAAASGFVSRRIWLDPRSDQQLDIVVVALCGGTRHTVLTQRLGIVWFDPDNELFARECVGPFLFPRDFDKARLATFPECAPVFLLSADAHRVREDLSARGHSFPDGRFVLDVLKALVDCHDVYHAYRRKYFVHLDRDLSAYAIGRFDLHAVLNGLIALLHERVRGDRRGRRPIHWLPDRESLLAIPLLRTIYPNAEFLCLRPSLAALGLDRLSAYAEALREARPRSQADPDPYASVWLGKAYGELLQILKREAVCTGMPQRASFRDVRGTDRLLSELGRGADDFVPSPELSRAPVDPLAPRASTPLASADSDDRPGHLPRFADPSPIIVLGAGRSGTSAMVGAIKAAGIDGFHEGHVFPMLNEMLKRVSLLPDGHMRSAMLRVIAEKTVEPIYGGNESRIWVTKTPDHAMIDCVGLIRAMYPRARFVMMRRHPVSFAESRRRKFGEALLSSINEWIKCIDSWKAARGGLPPSAYVERDMQELRDAKLNEELSVFLGLDTAQRKTFCDYLATERPEFTRAGQDSLAPFAELADGRLYNVKTIFFGMLDSLGEYLEDTAWSSDQKEQVVKLLGSLPEELGYTVRRPDGQLLELMVAWAKALEQYRETAEFHERNAMYWYEMAENWRIAAEARSEPASPGSECAPDDRDTAETEADQPLA